MIQIKARIAGKASAPAHAPYLSPVGKASAPAHAPYLRPVGNAAPLSRTAMQSWVIFDVPKLLIYEDRPKRALASSDGVIHSAVDDYSGVWMPYHVRAGFGCVSHNHPSS